MSTQKAVIITAAAIVGVVGIVVIAVVLIEPLAGTPIIIKGSSAEGADLVMYGRVPTPNGEGKPDHTVWGEPTTIKLTSAGGKCMFYKFGSFDDFNIDLKTEPTYDEVFVEDKDFVPLVGMKFDEGRFNYDSANKKYTSTAPRQIKSLSIVASGAQCYIAGGEEKPCPPSIPNEWVTLVDLTIEVGDEAGCP